MWPWWLPLAGAHGAVAPTARSPARVATAAAVRLRGHACPCDSSDISHRWRRLDKGRWEEMEEEQMEVEGEADV